ncbi:hypothetical protein Anapl_01528 [Anas platyrhynchos]|uniref:Uncharacterized protein n=1 Tax=Anas platyrhynchos TaxID=8839 RepID=R0JW97_ANAPL|nr:hypothetical protein Anapl_01528 [Anas platyrhynchos]
MKSLLGTEQQRDSAPPITYSVTWIMAVIDCRTENELNSSVLFARAKEHTCASSMHEQTICCSIVEKEIELEKREWYFWLNPLGAGYKERKLYPPFRLCPQRTRPCVSKSLQVCCSADGQRTLQASTEQAAQVLSNIYEVGLQQVTFREPSLNCQQCNRGSAACPWFHKCNPEAAETRVCRPMHPENISATSYHPDMLSAQAKKLHADT